MGSPIECLDTLFVWIFKSMLFGIFMLNFLQKGYNCILCYTIYVIVFAFEFAGFLSQHLSCKKTDHIEVQESMINIVLRLYNVRNCYFYRFCLRNKNDYIFKCNGRFMFQKFMYFCYSIVLNTSHTVLIRILLMFTF